jgi:hypothetical protein
MCQRHPCSLLFTTSYYATPLLITLTMQGQKFKFFLNIQLGNHDSKFSIPPENPVSHFWILVTISVIPCPIQISFHNSHRYKLQ